MKIDLRIKSTFYNKYVIKHYNNLIKHIYLIIKY